MFSIFKKKHVLAKFYPNEIEVIRLDNMRSLKRKSNQQFSTERMIVADFHVAEQLLSQLLKEIKGNSLFNQIVLITQQKYDFQDGLSEAEKRIYRDLAEHAGALEVYILKDSKEIPVSEIFSLIKNH